MFRCFICNNIFTKTSTHYRDGRDPCPDCVGSYKAPVRLQSDQDPGELSLEEIMENEFLEPSESFSGDYTDE